MSTAFVLFVCLASPAIFAAAVWLTRAGARRATAALAGGVAAAILNIFWDSLAARMDWWSYTFSADAIATLALYVPVAFVYGGAFGLVGWRIIREVGWVGVALFFSMFVGLGVIRDHIIAVNGDTFLFGPGGTPHVADAVGYLALALAVQVTMLLMAGPPKRDQLRAS